MKKHLYSWAALNFLSSMLAFALFLSEKGFPYRFTLGDVPALLLPVLHVAAGLYYLAKSRERSQVYFSPLMAKAIQKRLAKKKPDAFIEDEFFLQELLLALSLVIFVFSYLHAMAANMDYVQRFIATGGNLQLAIDSRQQRMVVMLRYGMYLLIYPAAVWFRLLTAAPGERRKRLESFFRLLLLLLGAALHAFAFPSFLAPDGMGYLGWIALVPLFYLLRNSGFQRFIFYGVFWTLLSVMLRNYWLGTFSLVSLQVAVLVLGGYSLLFFLVLWLVESILRKFALKFPDRFFLHAGLSILAYASLWTLYDWIQTQGFLAYPWSLLPHSQWKNLPLMQILPLSGMWGIALLLYAVNALIAFRYSFAGYYRQSFRVLAGMVAGLLVLVHGYGIAVLIAAGPPQGNEVARVELGESGELLAAAGTDRTPGTGMLRIALVQQNSDPHKHDYEDVLDTLISLSDSMLAHAPDIDLIAWSETAFVPNISRWSDPEETSNPRLGRVVGRMRDYQRSMGTWLLTGNDDYQVTSILDGVEQRDNYNAALLFSPEGERVDSYHKIKLVPFTEHFPFEEQLPGLYRLLQDFDVHFWTPGSRRTIFAHPRVSFFTPICFEDAFPLEIREFVLDGGELILNISNDYWSLTEVAATQHLAAAIFRAPETRRWLLRSTASGETMAVDPYGRILSRLPQYRAAAVAYDIPQPDSPPLTVYSRQGDLFLVYPFLAVLSILVLGLVCCPPPLPRLPKGLRMGRRRR